MEIHVDKYDDWIKVYADNRLMHSGHGLGYRDWLELFALAGVIVTVGEHDTDGNGEVVHSYPLEHIKAKGSA
jgi:hypothetical protein